MSSSSSSLEAARKEEPAGAAASSSRPLVLAVAGSRGADGRYQLEHVRLGAHLLPALEISGGYRVPNGGAWFGEAGWRFKPPF